MPPGAGRFAASRENRQEVGDRTVRDPGLLSIEGPAALGASSAHGHGGHVGARFLFRQREPRDHRAGGDLGQVGLLDSLQSEQADGAGSQALHGENEIGETGMIGQDLACQAERANVEGAVEAAMVGRHRRAQEAGPAEKLDEAPAIRVDVGAVAVKLFGMLPAPGIEVPGIGTVAVLEERPGKICPVGHVSHLRKPVSAWRRRRDRRARNPLSACRSPAPAPAPPPRRRFRRALPIPSRAGSW